MKLKLIKYYRQICAIFFGIGCSSLVICLTTNVFNHAPKLVSQDSQYHNNISSTNDDKTSKGVKLYGAHNRGVYNSFVDPVVMSRLNRVRWQKNKYSKKLLKTHGKSAGNNYGLNDWIDTTVNQNGDDINSDRVVTQLPNCGDTLFARDAYGTDFLRSVLWKKPLASDPNIYNSQKNYFDITNALASDKKQRAFLHIGMDFGLPLTLIHDDKLVNNNADNHQNHLWFSGATKNIEDQNSRKINKVKINDTYKFYQANNASQHVSDSHNIFRSLLGNLVKNDQFKTSLPAATVTTVNDLKTEQPNTPLYNSIDDASKELRPPVSAYNLKLFNIDSNLVDQASNFLIGAFGLTLDNFLPDGRQLFLTFTYQTDIENQITNVRGRQTNAQGINSQHLIIDVNEDVKSQHNELSDIYNYLDYNKNYSTQDKLSFLNTLDGKKKSNPANNSTFDWKILGREAFSLLQHNAFGEPTVINRTIGNIITSDRYNKLDPNRNLHTGFNPELFANFVMQQVWPYNYGKKVDTTTTAQQTYMYCTKNRFKIYDGYERDRTIASTNIIYYTAPNYATFDAMSFYETSFYFKVNYIAHENYWKLGQYYASSQYYFFPQVLPRPAQKSSFPQTVPMLEHFGSGFNQVKIPLLWLSNLHFPVGGIVAITIVMFIAVGSFLFFRPWKKISILSTKNIEAYLKANEKAEIAKQLINLKQEPQKKEVELDKNVGNFVKINKDTQVTGKDKDSIGGVDTPYYETVIQNLNQDEINDQQQSNKESNKENVAPHLSEQHEKPLFDSVSNESGSIDVDRRKWQIKDSSNKMVVDEVLAAKTNPDHDSLSIEKVATLETSIADKIIEKANKTLDAGSDKTAEKSANFTNLRTEFEARESHSIDLEAKKVSSVGTQVNEYENAPQQNLIDSATDSESKEQSDDKPIINFDNWEVSYK